MATVQQPPVAATNDKAKDDEELAKHLQTE
jgi:hypothetical protein